MNKTRRKDLAEALDLIRRAIDIVEQARNDEQYSLDNMPENLQESEKCQTMEECVDHLEDAVSSLKESCDLIEEAMS